MFVLYTPLNLFELLKQQGGVLNSVERPLSILPNIYTKRDTDGTPIRFRHFEQVLLGKNIEIGTNAVISKISAIEDTLVGDSTKMDGLVYVAHNYMITKYAMFASATLCSYVQLGDGAWIGSGASIKQTKQTQGAA